ncbi:MAG: ArsA family ATPase [Acidimicrobiia bacterium]
MFTGKGGVGKTTTAAATALRCARAGLRTIVLSTDPAHSLADALDHPLGDEVSEVLPGLWGQQLDAADRLEEAWHEVREWMVEVFRWAGVEGLEAEELSVVPGLDEIFALGDIKACARSGRWDVVVVDCAPTAETIRLLSLPDVLSRYMERLFPVGRRVNKVVAPVLSRVTSLPVAGDGVFAATQRAYERLDGVRELLADASTTSVRLVVNPERMVVAEARRTYTYLSLFGYRVDAVVANRVLPAAVDDPWFAGWRAAQAEQLATIREGFAPLPVLTAEMAPAEPIGPDALDAFGAALYDGRDPAALLHRGEPLRMRTRDGRTTLSMDLPFAGTDDLELSRRDDELLVRVGPHRRAVLLPTTLRRRPVLDARLRQGTLRVVFDVEEHPR